MEVLLLEDIKGVGRRNEIRDVSDGYARNFLIPKKLAVPADQKAVQKKESIDKEEQDLLTDIKRQAEKLKEEMLEFSVRVGKKGEIFSSVNRDEIKKSLSAKGYTDFDVNLSHPIKSLGDHSIPVSFSRGVKSNVKATLVSQQ